MNAAPRCVLTINVGSSSIRFAVFEVGRTLLQRLDGKIDRIGSSGTHWTVNDSAGKSQVSRRLAVTDHRKAVDFLLDWLEAQPVFASVRAVGHRVVHGMRRSEPERVTPKLLAQLDRITPYAKTTDTTAPRIQVLTRRRDDKPKGEKSWHGLRQTGSGC